MTNNGEILRFLRYRKTPPREDIRPKKLCFDKHANINYFGDHLDNNENFSNADYPSKKDDNNFYKNSVGNNNGYLSGKLFLIF